MKFDLVTCFLVLSLLMACLVYVEAALLLKNQGKMPQSNFFAVISLMTSVWVLVSAVAWYFLDFAQFGSAVAVAYPLYALIGFFYSGSLIKSEDLPDDPMDMVVPAKYLSFCQSFAQVYGLASVLALAQVLGLIDFW